MADLAHPNTSFTDDVRLTCLFRRIEKGERAALSELYDRTCRLLFGLTLKILHDRLAAEECLLDVYVDIWNDIASYNPEQPPLEWLLMLARARALARLGKNGARPMPTTDDGVKTVAPTVQKVAAEQLLSLAPMQRGILDLAYASGLSASEIAARIGSPLGAVKTHVRIGLSRLRQSLTPVPASQPDKHAMLTTGRDDDDLRIGKGDF